VRTSTSKTFKTIAFLVILVLVIVSSGKIASAFRIKLVDLSAPALKFARDLASLPRKIMPFAYLSEENNRLRSRITFLTSKIKEMNAVAEENNRLNDLLGFKKSAPYAMVPAQVIGRDPSNWSNSLIIDKGSVHGIKRNSAVLSVAGLVGRTTDVGRYSSKVLLISDPNSKVGVVIQKNRQGGILTGRPDGKCRMIYIALDSDVAIGDKVITAGFGGIFPKNVLAGSVAGIDKEPGRLYKYAVVKPAQDLSKIEEVLCIK
jgi:rod shape-determining protein MreC